MRLNTRPHEFLHAPHRAKSLNQFKSNHKYHDRLMVNPNGFMLLVSQSTQAMGRVRSDTICNNIGPYPKKLVGRFFLDFLVPYQHSKSSWRIIDLGLNTCLHGFSYLKGTCGCPTNSSIRHQYPPSKRMAKFQESDLTPTRHKIKCGSDVYQCLCQDYNFSGEFGMARKYHASRLFSGACAIQLQGAKYLFSINVESDCLSCYPLIFNARINLINWTRDSESATYLLHGYLDYAHQP